MILFTFKDFLEHVNPGVIIDHAPWLIVICRSSQCGSAIHNVNLPDNYTSSIVQARKGTMLQSSLANQSPKKYMFIEISNEQ
jgi:hypothetical protein